jgi:two-component system invasion response regulator UvrY
MIKIGIVDDHAIVRSGLKQFFSDQVDLRVVGEAGSGREAIDLVRNVELDILVMDLSMPGQSGIDALAMIRAKAPDVGILILSGYPEEHYAVNLIRQGASGYLNKECDPSEIVDAIRVISLGKRYITPAVAELLAQQLNRPNDVASHEQLSEREFQVFLKLAKGETAGDIAKALVAEREDGKHLPHARDGKDEPFLQQRPDLLRAQEQADRLSSIEGDALLDAIVHQGVDFIGFVEDRIDAQLGATLANVGRGVVAQHHHFLPGRAIPAGGQHPQATSLFQKQVNNRQIPIPAVLRQPGLAFVFGFSGAYGINACQFLKCPDQVFTNGGIVFYDVRFQSHCSVQVGGAWLSKYYERPNSASVSCFLMYLFIKVHSASGQGQSL